MSQTQTSSVPMWFWIVSGIALVWNAIGALQYFAFVTITEEALAALPAAERALYENVAPWATAAFAIATFGGVVGCLLLLLRKSLAFTVLIVSLVAVLVQQIRNLALTNFIEVYGPGVLLPFLLVTIISVFLVWFARMAKGKGWIR